MDDYTISMAVKRELSEGMVIKNYKELCSVLSIPVCGGDQKKRQLKDLGRFFDYEMQGRAFVIREVFALPKEREDERKKGNNNKYTKLIEQILICYFYKSDFNQESFSMSGLWHLLGMVNEDYFRCRKIDEKTISYLKDKDPRVSKWYLNQFYTTSSFFLRKTVLVALRSLDKRGIFHVIDYYEGKKNDNRVTISDLLELKQLESIQNRALKHFGCKSVKEVIFNKNKDINYESYKQYKDELILNEMGYKDVYLKYSIACCNTEDWSGGDVLAIKKELNKEIKNKLMHDAQETYEKSRRGIPVKFPYPTSYEDIMFLLYNELMEI